MPVILSPLHVLWIINLKLIIINSLDAHNNSKLFCYSLTCSAVKMNGDYTQKVLSIMLGTRLIISHHYELFWGPGHCLSGLLPRRSVGCRGEVWPLLVFLQNLGGRRLTEHEDLGHNREEYLLKQSLMLTYFYTNFLHRFSQSEDHPSRAEYWSWISW